MEPFSVTHGTLVATFSREDNDATVVITRTDTSRPDAAPQVQYEQCEDDAEATAVIQKMVFDLERQGWALAD